MNPELGVNVRPESNDDLPAPVQTGVSEAPVRPSEEHPRINRIIGPMAEQSKEIGLAIVLRRRAEGKANIRLEKLMETTTNIKLELEKSDNPNSSIVSNLIVRSTKDAGAIEEELDEFNKHAANIEIHCKEMLNDEDEEGFDVDLYSPWLNFLIQMNKHMFSVLDNSIKDQLRNLEEVKKTIQDRIEANSLPSSRNSSITRGGNVRNAVDYMKPPVLVYISSTLIQVSDHMISVTEWMRNMYEEGATFEIYRSNLNTTLDKDWHEKT